MSSGEFMKNNNFFNSFKCYIDEFVEVNFYCLKQIDVIKQNAYVVFDKYYSKFYDSVYTESIKQLLYKHFYFQVLAYSLNNIDLLNFEDRVKLSRKVIDNLNKKGINVTVLRLMEIYCLNERTAIDIINYSNEEYKKDIYSSKKEIVYDTFEDDVINNIQKKILKNVN